MSGGAAESHLPTSNLQQIAYKSFSGLIANLPGIDCVILAFLCTQNHGI
jgi:hypothetical protein